MFHGKLFHFLMSKKFVVISLKSCSVLFNLKKGFKICQENLFVKGCCVL